MSRKTVTSRTRHRFPRPLSLLAVAILLLMIAGVAAPDVVTGAARLLRASTGASTSGLPAASRIKHIVFILEENRSFDNVFGRFPGADGATTALVANGKQDVTIPLVPEPYYLWHDLGHDQYDARISVNNGRMDGFSNTTFSDIFGEKAAYQQLMPGDIPNFYAYAQHFTLSDRTFAPVPGPTFPTHLHAVAAQDGGVISNPQNTANPTNAWGCDASPGTYVLLQRAGGKIGTGVPCFSYATLADSLNKAHLSWAYYAAPPTDVGYMWSTLDAFKQIRDSTQWNTQVKDERTFQADARAGRLPAFSWVTPRAGDSTHPPAPVCPGENWVVNKVNAVMSGPDWNSTMIVLAWDDWGGYYDHVAPPPARTGSYGLRVPLLIISPYARRSYVSHTLYTFESVLRTAEKLWGLAPLTNGDRYANGMLDSLDFAQAPAAPFVLQPRHCAPPLTAGQYHTYLDQALEHAMSQLLHLSVPAIELLHHTNTLSQIATMQGVKPADLLTALKGITQAWAGGKVILQLVTPQQSGSDTYLAMRGIDAFFQTPPGTPLFPTH